MKILFALLTLPFSILAATSSPISTTASSASSSCLSLISASSASPDPAITAPPAAPEITTPPSLDDISWAIQQKWHLTTYWSCATFKNGYEHCGWHEPVLPGGDEIAGANGRGVDARRVGVVAGLMVMVALLR